VLEKPTTCKFGAPTQDGGKSSDTPEETSRTSKAERFLMFQVVKMLKAKRLLSGANTTKPTRDGQLSMLTELPRKRLLDLIDTSVSKLTKHSTSDQDSQ
jgi:hypothetical protein